MTKPVGIFTDFLGLVDGPRGMQARLGGVRHPVLGAEPTALTSRIRRIDYDDAGQVCALETLNTAYLRSDYVPVESLGREKGA